MAEFVSCENCYNWHNERCCAHPPIIVEGGVAIWPKTKKDDWCNEWEENSPDSEPETPPGYATANQVFSEIDKMREKNARSTGAFLFWVFVVLLVALFYLMMEFQS